MIIDTVAATMDTFFSWSGLTGVADRSHVHDAPSGISRFEPPNDRFFHEVIEDVFDATGQNFLRTSVTGGYVDCGTLNGGGIFCAPATGSLHDTLFNLNDRFDPNDPLAFADMNAFVTAMETDGLYIDIHTEAYPNGEIRGQLLFSPVPEPSSLALLGIGMLAVGAVRRRRPVSPAE